MDKGMTDPKSLLTFNSNGNVIVDNSAGVRVLAGPKGDMKDYTEEFNSQIARNGYLHISGDSLTGARFHNIHAEGFGISVPADGLLRRYDNAKIVKVKSWSWMCDGCHASLKSDICDYCGSKAGHVNDI